jgi:hypothetical protein
MDPVHDPLLLRKFGKAGNQLGTFGSVARNSGNWATESITPSILICLCINRTLFLNLVITCILLYIEMSVKSISYITESSAQQFHHNYCYLFQWLEHITKKNVMSSTSNSGKCIGCLDAILSCQSTIKSYYTSKLYVQFGVMVSSFGAALVILIFNWFNATKKMPNCIANAPC